MAKIDIKSLNMKELQEEMIRIKEQKFRARQLYEWLHVRLAMEAADMTNLPRGLRQRLEQEYQLDTLKPEEVQVSKKDGTRKYLFELVDGNVVESVWMQYSHGNSVCISSQVGCRMGCRFCASAIGGLTRSLTVSEMLDQIYHIQNDTGARVSNVVVMGTGEPLDNYDNLLKFIGMLSDENGLHISQRNITVSTCGLVPQMRRLAGERLQITLALSLHASTQEKRQQLMPVAYQYELTDVLDACLAYFRATGRRITFEYSLVGGVNDSETDAKELAGLIRGINAHVNLIPVNPVRERDYIPPDKKTALKFKNKLEKYGINVTIRREMGQDIDGACGQLRKRHTDDKADQEDGR